MGRQLDSEIMGHKDSWSKGIGPRKIDGKRGILHGILQKWEEIPGNLSGTRYLFRS